MKKKTHLALSPASLPAETPTLDAENLRLLHALRVHQIELETQNEELMGARADLEAALARYTDLYDFAPVGYMTLTRDGAIEQVNLAGASLLGMTRDQLAQRRLGQFVAPQSRGEFNAFLETVFDNPGKVACEVALLAASAEPLWARLEAIRSGSVAGQPEACRAVMADITAARRAQDALRQSEEHFRALAQALPDAVYALELPEQKVSYFNHEVFLGYSRAELMADISVLGAQYPDEKPVYSAHWQRTLRGETLAPLEYRVRTKDGEWEWVQSRAAVQTRDQSGQPTQLVVILSIITERKQAGEALRHLSTHDALTGVYNRLYFEEELLRLERGRRFPISVVLADVDRLKETNDRLGHAAGDVLLKRVAQVLITAFRGEDVVTRIGGDEFAVLLPATDAAAAASALARVRQVVRETNAGHEGLSMRLSLGVSTAESQAPLAGVLQEADAAMYRDKRARDGP